MNKKTIRLYLACLVALSAGFSACDREPITSADANFHSIANSNGLSKRVADVVEVAPNEYVFWGTELQSVQSNFRWDLYAVRVNAQGIVWEQRYQPNAEDDQAMCLRWYNNELWAVGYQDGANENSTVFKIDAANGAIISTLNLADVKINDAAWDNANSNLIVTGSTSNVNTNKPEYNSSTDTRDVFTANIEPNTNALNWRFAYGFGGVDEAKVVYSNGSQLITFTNMDIHNGQQTGTQTGTVVLNAMSGAVYYQRNFDYLPNTLDLGAAVSNAQTNGFELVALTNSGDLVRQSVSAPTTNTVTYNNQNTSIQNLQVQNLFANGTDYLLTGNNNGQAKIYKLDNNFATQNDVTLSAAQVANNATNVAISKGISIGNNQFLVAVNYTLNGVQEIGYVKVDSNGNLIP